MRNKSPIKIALISACAVLMAACNSNDGSPQSAALPPSGDKPAADFWPDVSYSTDNADAVERRVQALLAPMTVEQKVAQLIQPEIRDITVEDMRRYGFGSYLNGGGAFPNNNKHATAQDWVDLAEAMYQASVDDSQDGSSIPTMWGTDAVHGHNNVIGATIFPHNIGLGAMDDAALITRIADATAKEVRATGIDWIFAPTVAVARDDRWGRTYESYSEDPEIVGKYARAIVSGLQGDIRDGHIDDSHVISTVKHFIGDGGTEGGDDQGDNLADEKALLDIHGQGYVHGLQAGAQSVMASFNSWHGKKIHGSKYLLTNVLKDKMGFDGFVVGDWNGHGQIAGCTNENCPQAINAGLDVYMVPTQAWKPLFENLVSQVESGEISQQRLDDAVSRVLRVKVRAGLFEMPSPAQRSMSANEQIIGSDDHRAIAREAVRKSLVLLKNKNNILPLSPDSRVLVAGDAADNIGKQSGGWTITWQGTGNTNEDFPGATSIFDGIQQTVNEAGGHAELSVAGEYSQRPDVAIVVFGENPYAEGNGDLSNLEYQRGDKSDLALLQKLKEENIPVVSVFITGRPLWVNPELNASDAFVVAWLPGSEGHGVADVLFTDKEGNTPHPITGNLSFSWPATPSQAVVNKGDGVDPLFPYGYGLSYTDTDTLADNLSTEVDTGGADALEDHEIYVLTLQKPWQIQAKSGEAVETMTSNVLETEQVTVRTTDRKVQEDSLHIEWNEAASVGFYSPFPEDLRDYAGDEAGIIMDVKVEDGASALSLSVLCEENCNDSIPLNKLVQSSTEWQTITLPTRCLTSNEANIDRVFSPLIINADGAASATISNIRLTASGADGSCPE